MKTGNDLVAEQVRYSTCFCYLPNCANQHNFAALQRIAVLLPDSSIGCIDSFLSLYRFILLFRKGRMLDVTAKLGTGFRGTCCKIRQNLYQDSEYFSKESRSFEAAQAYRVYCTSLLCPPDRAGLYHGTRWIKWWLQAFFLHKIMYCHHLSLPIHREYREKVTAVATEL